ncbi:unnamed protein product [Boreogadus saida]
MPDPQCTPIEGHGFVLDKYKCQCRKGFYHPSRVALNGFTGGQEPAPPSREGPSPEVSGGRCLPCREGCPFCRDDTPCLVQQSGGPRLALATAQGLVLALDLACMLVVYHFRSNKRIRTSGLVLVETILFGALLLYAPALCRIPNALSQPYNQDASSQPALLASDSTASGFGLKSLLNNTTINRNGGNGQSASIEESGAVEPALGRRK